jgi:hypothetical protein
MNTITLAAFNSRAPAESLARRLEETGVCAVVHDQSRLQRFAFLAEPFAAFHLDVERSQFDAACDLVRRWDAAEGVLREAVRCPECGSARVEYPQMTRKFVTPDIAVLGYVLRFVDKKFYCQECQFTWSREPAVPPAPWDGSRELDILGWPRK